MNRFGFYATPPDNPFLNMAMDEWMFAKAFRNPGMVLLRLYGWDRGAITFGLNQKLESTVNLTLLAGTPLIRRITGGRALYHEMSELTYSIAANTENLAGSVLNDSLFESSKRIAQALVNFLSEIGISAQYMRQSSPGFHSPGAIQKQHCFQSIARHEIVSDGTKIVASAQRRINAAFLQHGSIKVTKSSSHQAIAPESSKLIIDSAIPKVSEADFNFYSSKFLESFSKSLSMNFENWNLNENELQEIKEYQLFLENHSLLRRHLFKQNPTRNSLYQRAVN